MVVDRGENCTLCYRKSFLKSPPGSGGRSPPPAGPPPPNLEHVVHYDHVANFEASSRLLFFLHDLQWPLLTTVFFLFFVCCFVFCLLFCYVIFCVLFFVVFFVFSFDWYCVFLQFFCIFFFVLFFICVFCCFLLFHRDVPRILPIALQRPGLTKQNCFRKLASLAQVPREWMLVEAYEQARQRDR